MIRSFLKVRLAVPLAPLLILPLIATFAGGCGKESQVDPNIKVEAGKSAEESVLKKGRVGAGKTAKAPGPKQRVSGGPD